MTLASTLAAGRRLAESLMLDTCAIGRPGTPDPLTGVPALTTVYTGRCKIQGQQVQEQTPDVAGHVFTVQRYEVHIPVGAYSPAVGDVVTLTAVAFDPNLVGRAYRVRALLHKSQATAYRLGIEDVAA